MSSGDDPVGMSAVRIADAVSHGRLDPMEVLEAFHARIEAGNGALDALVRYDPSLAREEARRVQARIRAGERMPLAGVPLVVKDNIYVAGRRISQGSLLFSEFIPDRDAIAVQRARAAGAVIIGIGNCPEFACKGQTNSPLHGIARNPIDHSLTPGGSSGGNASAIAARFAPLALGTDGGGSGRRPPAHTGTVGFKPSFGAIPYGPGFPEPFWSIAAIAPMARTVGDTMALFASVAGPDPRDPESFPIEADCPNVELSKLRIAYGPRLGLDVPVDDAVSKAIDAAVDDLSSGGWRIEVGAPRWPPDLREDSLMPLQAGGLAAIHGDAFRSAPHLFDPDIAAQLRRGLSLTAADVGNALEASAAIRRAVGEFFTDFDLLLTPTTPCTAWPANQIAPTHIGGRPVGPRGHAVFTPFFNHALTPAISIPCGVDRNGLPIGLQIVGPRGADWRVLRAAKAAETLFLQKQLSNSEQQS